jgi:hypothetical protein
VELTKFLLRFDVAGLKHEEVLICLLYLTTATKRKSEGVKTSSQCPVKRAEVENSF